MKNRIGFLLKVIICLLLILNTTGCWSRREMNTLAIVMGLGFDKPEESGNVQITAQIAKPGGLNTSPKGGGNNEKGYWNIKSTGDTIFSAVRGFTHESSRRLFFPHNQVLIFSHDLAEEGVQKYIDFFVRDHETRLKVWILVSKGTAEEVLDVKSELENTPAMNIADLIEIQTATSQTSVVKLEDFLTRLMSKTTAPIAPIVEVSGKGEERTVRVSGTAVFKKDKLVGQLDETETRGLLWVINEVKSGIIEVDCPRSDGKASLEIIRASSKITPEIEDNKILMKMNIKEEGNLGDQSCSENLVLPTGVASLEKEKAAAIQSEVLAALKKAQELNTDIFDFGEAIHQKYPEEWKDLESRWDEVFPNIEVEINVEAKLRLAGKINWLATPEQE